MPQYKQVWKTGFPPRKIHSPTEPALSSAAVSTLLQNRECIVLEVDSTAQLTPPAATGTAGAGPPAAGELLEPAPLPALLALPAEWAHSGEAFQAAAAFAAEVRQPGAAAHLDSSEASTNPSGLSLRSV